MLTPRQDQILRMVVETYAASGQPVGSKALAAAPESTRAKLRRGHALDEQAERALERELRRRALGRYRSKEREARAMRLLTSENIERGAD